MVSFGYSYSQCLLMTKSDSEEKCPKCEHEINIYTNGFFLFGQKEIVCDGCKQMIVVTVELEYE